MADEGGSFAASLMQINLLGHIYIHLFDFTEGKNAL